MGIAKSKIKSLAGKVFSGIAVFAFAFFASYLSSSHFAPVSRSEAASGTGTYYANISSSGSIDITLQSTPDGVYKVGKDSLSIDTNSTVGYKLYISTEDKSNISLDSSIPANGLIDSATGAYISPSSGTVDTPVRLSTNTWGYTTSRANNTETSTAYTDADAAPTEAKGGKAVWRAVPEYGSEDIFYTNSSPATSSTNSVDVYYAVNASTALPSGTYSNTVVYTAIVEGNAPSSASELTISPASQQGLAAGETVTISTGLYPGFNLDSLGEISVKIGDNNCTSVTPSIDNTNGNLVVTCIVPAQTTAGAYTVTATIAKYGKVYTLEKAYTYIPKFYTITTMQEMTHDICFDSNVVTPNLTTMSNVVTKDNWLASDNTLTQGTPQTVLTDTRDGNQYTIRKFGDGKCWMARNLRYAPTTATRLSADTSDVLSTNTWTMPKLGTYNSGYTDDNGDEVMEGSYGSIYDATYYSWHTATAGTGTSSMTSGNTTQSICPKNWRLPTGGSGAGTIETTVAGSDANLVNGDFSTLDIAFGGTGENNQNGGRANWVNSVYGFNASLLGCFDGGTAYFGDSRSHWWSSSMYNGGYAYYLHMLTSGMFPQVGGYTGLSFALRCVAR